MFTDCLSCHTRYINIVIIAAWLLWNFAQWRCGLFFLGSHAAFQRVYEDPIVLSRQPAATPEEKEIGETRANEVRKHAS